MRQLTTRSGAQPKEKKTRKIPVKLKNVKKDEESEIFFYYQLPWSFCLINNFFFCYFELEFLKFLTEPFLKAEVCIIPMYSMDHQKYVM